MYAISKRGKGGKNILKAVIYLLVFFQSFFFHSHMGAIFILLFPLYKPGLKTHCNLSPDLSMLWIRPYSNRHRLICARHLYYLLPAAVMCKSYISLV